MSANLGSHGGPLGSSRGPQVTTPLDATDASSKLICMQCTALLPFVAMHWCMVPMMMWQLWVTLGQPLIGGGHAAKMGVLLY